MDESTYKDSTSELQEIREDINALTSSPTLRTSPLFFHLTLLSQQQRKRERKNPLFQDYLFQNNLKQKNLYFHFQKHHQQKRKKEVVVVQLVIEIVGMDLSLVFHLQSLKFTIATRIDASLLFQWLLFRSLIENSIQRLYFLVLIILDEDLNVGLIVFYL